MTGRSASVAVSGMGSAMTYVQCVTRRQKIISALNSDVPTSV